MELDPVVQTFEADVAPFLAGIEAAKAAAEAFRDAIYEDIAAIKALQAAMAGFAARGGFAEQAQAADDARDAAVRFAEAAAQSGRDTEEGARKGRDAFSLLDEMFDEMDASAARFAQDAAAAGQAAAGGADEAAGAYRDARDAALEYAAAGRDARDAELALAVTALAETEALVRATAVERAEVDLLRNMTEWRIAVARAQRAVAEATDEVTAGQIAYLAVSRDVSQETLQDAIHFGAAGEAARKYSDDTSSAAALLAQFGIDAEKAAAAARDAEDATMSLADVEHLLADASAAAREGNLAAAAAAYELAKATREADQAGGGGGGRGLGFRLFGMLPTTWTALHWAITGVAEALAVVIPAMVAAGSAGAVGLQGAVDVADRLRAVYTATEATGSYLGKTFSTGLGQGINQFTQSAGAAAGAGNRLHDSLQKAQDAAQPRVYELLGAAVNGMNDKFGVFNSVGSNTILMLDQFAAKLDVELAGPLGNLGTQLAQNAMPDLQGLGAAFGNLGHAIASAASAEPGMAELLLRIVDAVSQAIVWVSHFQGLMQTLFLAHEAQMWGGLVSNALSRVSAAAASGVVSLGGWAAKAPLLRTAGSEIEQAALGAGTALEGTASFLGGPWGTAIAGAAIGLTLLYIKLGGMKDATEQWIGSLESAVAHATGLQQIADTYAALQQVTQRLADSNTSLAAQMTQAQAQQASVAGQATKYMDGYSGAIQRAAQDNQDLSQAQQQLTQDWQTELGNVGLLSAAYKISFPEAAQLAADAGVSLTQSLWGTSTATQMANQQIRNLIAGYGGMAAVGGTLGNDINAISFASAIQNGNVQKLNQSWDTFISTVQGPSSGFLGFAQSLSQFGKDAQQAGATMDGLGGTFTTSSRNVNTAAIQLQQDFNSSVTSAETLLDSLRTVASITGNGGPLVAGIKDVVAAMIPMAGSNEAAKAQLFVLAQEAGGPASGSLASLAQWAGKTKDPLGNLYDLSMKASGAIQRLGADTQQLAGTMQSSLNQALVAQANTLFGVNQKTAVYLTDLKNFGPASVVTQSALDAVNTAVGNSSALSSAAAGSIGFLSQKQSDLSASGKAAHEAQQKVNADIARIQDKAPGSTADISALADAVKRFGDHSSQAQGARSALISDLEHMHVPPQEATTWVDNLIAALDRLNGKHVSTYISTYSSMINVPGTATATGPVPTPTFTGPVVPQASRRAAGWRVPGYGGGDRWPAMLEGGEAVVPKHLVAGIAPYLAAHRVPGFAGGGLVPPGGTGGHGHPGVQHWAPWSMGNVLSLWAAEMWASDKHRYGSGHPVALKEMEALLAATVPRGRLAGNPLWRAYSGVLRADMMPYGQKDELYWRLLTESHALQASEKSQVAHLEHMIREHALKHQPGWVRYYERKLRALETADARKLSLWGEETANLYSSLVLPQVPRAAYDKGGWLPTGLSVAYNGTGRPEPVGAARGGGDVHVHLHGDLADSAIWERMQVQTLNYGYSNTGRPAGVWQPGG